MRVRVYQPPGDVPCRVMRPNERLRLPGESDADFVIRIARLTEQRDPALVGLPFVDVPEQSLPSERLRSSNGTHDLDARVAWRIVGNAVVIVPAKVRPLITGV